MDITQGKFKISVMKQLGMFQDYSYWVLHLSTNNEIFFEQVYDESFTEQEVISIGLSYVGAM